MIRQTDFGPEYREITRVLSLGAVNGPYVTREEDGTPVLNLGEVAAELINSGWLAEVVREAKEATLLEAASDMERYAAREDVSYTEHVLVRHGAPHVLREYAKHYRRNEGENND